ncbi:MAG: prepilin-type N-terminal cleavage/methylation domain-containing protein [Gallionella sp.]
MKRNQSGFTLIEIAIVLVIIGLLLGGVLKGQELINSAKVKNLATDFKNVPIYIYGYQDKYKALPGDDSNAVTHLSVAGASGVVNGNGDGVINGAWNSITAADESFQFWQQIRLAGFGPGSTTQGSTDYIPHNAVGGIIGVTNALTNKPISTMSGTYIVCSSSIPFKFAKQLDVSLDDGNTATGSVQVYAQPATLNTPPTNGGEPAIAIGGVTDDTPVVVCMGY